MNFVNSVSSCVLTLSCLGSSVLLSLGCSPASQMDYSKAGLVSAGGQVMLDGQPLPNAVITFENADGQFSYGLTDSDGWFDLQFDSKITGVTSGEKVVRISTTRKILGLNSEDEGGDDAGERNSRRRRSAIKERVPPTYNQKSQLRVTVTESRSDYRFDLQS